MMTLKRIIGVHLACLLIAVCASGEQYVSVVQTSEKKISPFLCQDHMPNTVSSPAMFWLDCQLCQEWRELVKKIISDQDQEGPLIAMFPPDNMSGRELNYQDAFLDYGAKNHVSPRPASPIFQITHNTLQKLHEVGVPDELLEQLKLMKDQQFTQQDQFWEMVKQCGDHTSLMEYQTVILTFALTDTEHMRRNDGGLFQNAFSAHLSPGYQEDLASWSALLYYPQFMKETLLSSPKKSDTRKMAYPPNEDRLLFNIRALLKRWGVPKPSTLILVGSGLYLLLALLSRH